MELEACRLPIEPQKTNYSSALVFQIRDQRLILDIQPFQRQHLAPMRRQALSLQIAFCAVGQAVGKAELACREFLKIAGQTSVEGIASTKDHPGPRKECCDGAELEDVVGHFIDYTFGMSIEGF